MISGTIRSYYPTEGEARLVLDAVHADDDDFCVTSLAGASVVAQVHGSDVRSLLRAADDYLACLSVAEDVIKRG